MLILSLGLSSHVNHRSIMRGPEALSSSPASRQAKGTGKQDSSHSQQIQIPLLEEKCCLQVLTGAGVSRSLFQSLPRPGFKAPFIGLFHTPLGQPRQNRQCWGYFSISRWICLLAPSRASHGSVGAGAQCQVNIRRCRRKAAHYCPQDSTGPHTPSQGWL